MTTIAPAEYHGAKGTMFILLYTTACKTVRNGVL